MPSPPNVGRGPAEPPACVGVSIPSACFPSWQGELDELEREEFFRLKKVQGNKKKNADAAVVRRRARGGGGPVLGTLAFLGTSRGWTSLSGFLARTPLAPIDDASELAPSDYRPAPARVRRRKRGPPPMAWRSDATSRKARPACWRWTTTT